MNHKYGFTLVEILFVVIIAAGILAFAVPAYKRSRERSHYEAATGILMDIGNAVQMFNLDSPVSLPQNMVEEIKGSESAASASIASKKLSEYMESAECTGNNSKKDKCAVQALFSYNYLHPFSTSTGYEFYVINMEQNRNPLVFISVCSNQCQDANAVACMCRKGTADDCYYGAVYLTDGTIKRKSKDPSKCS